MKSIFWPLGHHLALFGLPLRRALHPKIVPYVPRAVVFIVTVRVSSVEVPFFIDARGLTVTGKAGDAVFLPSPFRPSRTEGKSYHLCQAAQARRVHLSVRMQRSRWNTAEYWGIGRG